MTRGKLIFWVALIATESTVFAISTVLLWLTFRPMTGEFLLLLTALASSMTYLIITLLTDKIGFYAKIWRRLK
jgi:hypothetical protein